MIFLTSADGDATHYESDAVVETNFPSQQLPVAREKWLLKKDCSFLLSNLPQASPPTADEREGWQANDYFTRYIDDQVFELLHEMTEETFTERTGWSLNSSPGEIKVFLMQQYSWAAWGALEWDFAGAKKPAFLRFPIDTRDRYFQLRYNLKFVNDLAVIEVKKMLTDSWKVHPLLDIVKMACLSLRSPQTCAMMNR